jgi:hypothetical protein
MIPFSRRRKGIWSLFSSSRLGNRAESGTPLRDPLLQSKSNEKYRVSSSVAPEEPRFRPRSEGSRSRVEIEDIPGRSGKVLFGPVT